MKSKYLPLAIIIFMGISVNLFGQNQKLSVAAFKGIVLKNSATVYVTQGSSQVIELEGKPEDIDNIVVEVRGDKLEIGSKKKIRKDNSHNVEVYTTVKQLNF